MGPSRRFCRASRRRTEADFCQQVICAVLETAASGAASPAASRPRKRARFDPEIARRGQGRRLRLLLSEPALPTHAARFLAAF